VLNFEEDDEYQPELGKPAGYARLDRLAKRFFGAFMKLRSTRTGVVLSPACSNRRSPQYRHCRNRWRREREAGAVGLMRRRRRGTNQVDPNRFEKRHQFEKDEYCG